MTKEELNDKYKDIQPLINFYWNNIRYRLINMINPIITIPFLGNFEIKKDKLYVMVLKHLLYAKKYKKINNLKKANDNFLKVKKLRKVQHVYNVIRHFRNFEN